MAQIFHPLVERKAKTIKNTQQIKTENAPVKSTSLRNGIRVANARCIADERMYPPRIPAEIFKALWPDVVKYSFLAGISLAGQ